MPSSPSAPKIDPNQVVAQQQKANQSAQAGSLVDQNNAFGSLTYNSHIDPATGAPRWTADTKYNPQQQAMLDNVVGFQGAAGSAGRSLFNSTADQYSHAPDFSTNTNSLTSKLLGQYTDYLKPSQNYQTSQLDAKLRTQGLDPGSPAYKQRMMDLQDNQNRSVSGFLAQIEPQAFDQAVKQYQLPLQTAQQLVGAGTPAPLSFQNTGAAQINPANVSSAEQLGLDAYKNQAAATNQRNAGIASVIGGVAGSAFGGPILGAAGSSLAGSLFGGGSPTMPTANSWQNGTSTGFGA